MIRQKQISKSPYFTTKLGSIFVFLNFIQIIKYFLCFCRSILYDLLTFSLPLTLNASFWVWNTWVCEDVLYDDLFQERFLNHHLCRYRCFLLLVDDKCSKLNSFIFTIWFFFIHALVINSILSPAHSWSCLFLKFENQYFLRFFLIWLFDLVRSLSFLNNACRNIIHFSKNIINHL